MCQLRLECCGTCDRNSECDQNLAHCRNCDFAEDCPFPSHVKELSS